MNRSHVQVVHEGSKDIKDIDVLLHHITAAILRRPSPRSSQLPVPTSLQLRGRRAQALMAALQLRAT